VTEPAGQFYPDNLRRLQPLHVLLSGSDQRFIRVTSFLLARRGYRVSHASPSDAVGAAKRDRADVVILESGSSRAAAARRAAQLAALSGAPGVLVVTDNEERFWSGLRTVEKWTPLDDLVDEIESASLHRPIPLLGAEGHASA
jgi:CheY-like chemotaxis protein